MTKLSLNTIFFAHFTTLRDARDGKMAYWDIFVFYALPAAISLISLCRREMVGSDVFGASASVFGIFAGLLINVEVAMFGVFLRKWDHPNDPASISVIKLREEKRRIVLKELNANIAYLILFCCIGIALSMFFMGLAVNRPIYTAIISFFYVHILLTLMMTSKRAFLLFDAEYHRK